MYYICIYLYTDTRGVGNGLGYSLYPYTPYAHTSCGPTRGKVGSTNRSLAVRSSLQSGPTRGSAALWGPTSLTSETTSDQGDHQSAASFLWRTLPTQHMSTVRGVALDSSHARSDRTMGAQSIPETISVPARMRRSPRAKFPP